ncbi:YgfZ/GcvT domain-containing protein [Aestuariirhabdus sp. LZHN29]|uniref:CAF17-like 4Fe-4S cluster assembly/insertion protein YgfZ n=1 Tax=Aestuariirhabdus sp. LZHN29 TaxID=3417462 RepID=UPI003CFAEC19
MSTPWQQFLQQQPAPRSPSGDDSWFCDLSSWSILSVQDGNPKQFLQGQLTCDLNRLEPHTSSLGACCNAKGRMLSNFRILPNASGYWLVMQESIVDTNIAHLNKFAVFFRSKLANAGDSSAGIGLVGPEAQQWLQQQGAAVPANGEWEEFLSGQLICTDEQELRYQLWLPLEAAYKLWGELKSVLPRLPQEQWSLADIRQGIAWVNSTTYELYTPHQFNMQALGGISFRKGCYTGQEIVARMQHLGKAKNRLYRARSSELPEQLPAPIKDDAGRNVGEVISCAKTDSDSELLAVIRNDAAEDKTLLFDENKVLTVAELPYAITNREHLQEEA